MKEPTCYKNVDKATSIDHILTNHARCFQHSGIYETGLSDSHKLTLTALKMFYAKQKPRIISTEITKTLITPLLGWTS